MPVQTNLLLTLFLDDPVLFKATAKLQLVIQFFDEIKEGSPELTIEGYNVNKITQLVGFYSDYQSYLL